MIRFDRNRTSGMAIPIVITIVLILAVSATALHIMMQQGRQQITTIVDEIVLLNVAEAILDKVICALKKSSWGSRWYKEEGQHAFGGSSEVFAGDESGVYINDLGYDGIDYYYHIEDVSYKDYYGEGNIPVGKNIKPESIVPHLARLHIQATYKEFVKTIQCELKFREPARLEPTMLYVQNYKIIPNPDKLDLSDTEDLAALKSKGQELFERAREKREENSGLNAIIEMVQQLKLKPGGELADPNNMEKFTSTDIDSAQSDKEKRITEYLWKARQVFRDFEVEKFNIVATTTLGPGIDYDEAIDYLLEALKLADTLPPENKQKRVPECLYYLGGAYLAKGDVTAGTPIKNGISDPDPVRQATIPLVTDHGPKLWLNDMPPAGIPVGSGIVDTNSGYSERSYYFKLAESCFYTIIKKFSGSKYIPRAFVRLYQVKLALSSRWGRAYAQNEARKVMKILKKKIDDGKYPGYYRVFDEDLRLLNLCRELYEIIRTQKIGFISKRDGNYEIYVMDAIGTDSPVNITKNPAGDWAPAWSPDGNRIAFHSTRDGNGEIYVMDAAGTGSPINITNHPAQDGFPVWSPDGNRIAFENSEGGGVGGNYEIYVMDTAGTGVPVNITNNPDNFSPAWSPDGDRIAFYSYMIDGCEIYVMDAAGTGVPVNITNNPAEYGSPAWSPDGDRIAFYSSNIDGCDVYVMDAAGTGSPVNMTNNPASDRNPAWSPNGDRIAFDSTRDGNDEIYVMDADGTGVPVNITNHPAEDYAPAWSPIMVDPFPDIFGP